MRITLSGRRTDDVVRPTPPCRTLREYVIALVDRLAAEEPALHARLRTVVGTRTARIRLDDETVFARFDGATLVVLDATDTMEADGEGGTDRRTTLDLLAGRIEVTDAILDGRLDATGEIEDLVRIFQAIEILLDGSTRNPSLQHLALDYGGDPCRPAPAPGAAASAWRRVSLDPDRPSRGELDMLRRLDLLP
jgi:hypothetical protein